MDEYITGEATCLACDEDSMLAVMEWPPKVFVCPVCSTPLILVDYNPDKDVAGYAIGRLPHQS